MSKRDVYILAVVRVKVSNIDAEGDIEAIEKAEGDVKLDTLLSRSFGWNTDHGELDYTAFHDQIVGYAVDTRENDGYEDDVTTVHYTADMEVLEDGTAGVVELQGENKHALVHSGPWTTQVSNNEGTIEVYVTDRDNTREVACLKVALPEGIA